MGRHAAFRGLAASLAVAAAALASAALAFEVRVGATLHAKPNSLWFEEAEGLARWQELRASGDAGALAAFEEDGLGSRSVWRFSTLLTVKVLDYGAATHAAHVEMLTPGRMAGTDWYVDAATLEE